MSLTNASSVSDLFIKLSEHLKNGSYTSFYDDEEEKIDINEHIIKLSKLHFWPIDSQHTVNGSQRSYLCGFLHRSVANRFAKYLSRMDKIVGVYDNVDLSKTTLYVDGVPEQWTKEDDYTVSYNVVFDNKGNPVIKPSKHIYDYGSEIDQLEGYFTDKDLEKEFLEQFIEVAVISSTFNEEDDNLFKLCADVLEEILEKDKIKSS